VTGDEITYPPLAHLPKSIRRHRSLQKGKSASAVFVGFLQMGQRSLMELLRGMGDSYQGTPSGVPQMLHRESASGAVAEDSNLRFEP